MLISEGNLHYRVPVSREDELGRVAASINTMTERLERQIQKERELETSKMDLITGVSHDLRTPLTSIIAYLDLLKSKSFHDQSEYERFVHNAYNKSILLKKLIDDLFEYTRLTSGNMRLSLQTVDVRGLLEQMLFEFEPVAAESSMVLAKDIGHAPVMAAIDGEKFGRAIDNLLMNAVKYSVKPGEISISLTSGKQAVSITIENEGTPISKEQERHLFERFYKADESRSNQTVQAGAGLGLSIVKQIAELHGGTVTLAHESGHYAFTLTIPVRSLPSSEIL